MTVRAGINGSGGSAAPSPACCSTGSPWSASNSSLNDPNAEAAAHLGAASRLVDVVELMAS